MIVSRRDIVSFSAAAGVLAGGGSSSSSRGLEKRPAAMAKESALDEVRTFDQVHGGLGSVQVRFFSFDKAPLPARFLIYDFPPGASEGVHTHGLGDKVGGAFDEYYFVLAGQGEMEIGGERVPVKPGDHVHTPLDVAHGIRNTHPHEHLRVFLTYIDRDAR